jgi:probable rRNA maturation factor
MELVELIVSKKEYDGYAAVVKNACEKALKKLKKKGMLEVYLVTNSQMCAINKATRGIGKTTNVLSFETHGFPRADKHNYLGEVYLAPEFIKKQKQDIELLAVHGMLHLLGYTHEEKRDRIVMEGVEDEILSFIVKS